MHSQLGAVLLQLCSHSTASLSILLDFVELHCFKEYIKSILVTGAHQESNARAGQASGGQISSKHSWLAIPLSAPSSWCFKTCNNPEKNCSGKASCNLNCAQKCYIKQATLLSTAKLQLRPPCAFFKSQTCISVRAKEVLCKAQLQPNSFIVTTVRTSAFKKLNCNNYILY